MIYHSAKSNWGVIDSLLEAMKSENFIEKQSQRVCKALFPRRRFSILEQDIAGFFGENRWQALCNGEPIWWGWKDPRTTLTFPIWMKVFPNGRILNILRNGIDVAISIHRRSLKQRQKIWKRLFPIDYIPETLDFNYCFKLWEQHIEYIDEKRVLIPAGQYLEMRYEDLLADPHPNLRQIAEFMAFPLPEERLEEVCRQINRRRLINTEYAKPYQKQISALVESPWMQKLDYSYAVDPGN
jgi:hypothetical protein